MVRKTSQWYAAECVRACCVCLAISVWVSKRPEKRERGAKETAKGEKEEEGDVHSKGGMGMEGKREQREGGGRG